MRIFISTGEVSGDLQGGLLVEALYRQASAMEVDLEIVALGGDRMAEAGAKLLGHTTGIGSVGLLEALPFIFPTLRVQNRAKRYLKDNPPDAIAAIDYAGPNTAISTFARRNLPHIPVAYYIAPQYWVWWPLKKDIERLVKNTDLFLAIFPGEARFFEKQGGTVEWVGHPLLDRMQNAPTREEARDRLSIPQNQLAIALFPFSRHQEVKYLLPVLLAAARKIQDKLPHAHFWIPISLPDYRSLVETQIQDLNLSATVLDGQSLQLMAAVDLAIGKSGTVNLELALMNVPQVVIYRLSPVTLWLAKTLFNYSTPFLSPPNLVLGESIVPELFQQEATPENIAQQGLDLLLNSERREQMQQDYQRMRLKLGEIGVSDRAARAILKLALQSTVRNE
ncbi:MAG: lipid-A-disaccharide synthase [Cyanobacteriota bacterium]|nr:lipid-A-disaccharide synthase [Cyanobacteriota bacterium]